MDINTLTIDEFGQLTPAHHREALRLYDKSINPLIERLAAVEDKATPEFDAERDQLLIWLQVRKVHENRLIELVAEVEDADSQPLQQVA